MTTAPVGSPTPAVELRFHPTDLDTETLREALKPLGSPSQAIEAALMTARLMVISQAKAEVAKMTGTLSAAKLIGIADLAWAVYAPRFVRSLGPVFAEEYLRTMRAAGAGQIPMATVYALAEQHASRVGAYYHESSRDALVGGFNTFVNRRMTERVAADRVLDGYGLTARGMAGYTSRSLDKAATVTPLKLRQRVLDYIGTSVRRRSKVFATQEQHNISQQAQQIAWMWMQDKGQLTPAAEKVWITARDEKVCPQCGPMHGVRVLLADRFRLPNGTEVYVPGMHPNCRCQVRLLDHPWKRETSSREASEVTKADWDPKEHPRGGDPENRGRFSAKARSARPVAEQERYSAFQRFLDTAAEQLETQPVIEPVTRPVIEPKPKVVIDDRPKLVISDPEVVINDRPPVVIDDPAKPMLGDLTRPMIADERVKPEFRASPRQRLMIAADTQKTVLRGLAEVRTQLAQAGPTPQRHKDTIRLDRPGGPGPMFYVAAPWEMSETEHQGDGLIDLNTEMEFGQSQQLREETQEDAIAREAREYFDNTLTAEADSIWENEENYIYRTDQNGTRLRALVPQDYLYDVVAAAAWNEPGGPGDDEIKIQWTINSPGTDEHGAPVATEYMRYSKIAREMKLTQEHFKVTVLVLTEGHNSDLGKTRQLSSGTTYGEEVWTSTGLYRLEPMTTVLQEEHGPPIQFMHLVPVGVEPYDVVPPGYVPPDLPE
jgi:hypothetical protein